MADTTDKYDAYTHTVLELAGVDGGRIDLRREIGERERDALRTVGLDRPFAVFTAENPHGENDEDADSQAEERRREEANHTSLARLTHALAADGTPFVRVDGSAPDGSYRERCVAVVMPRDDAVALARRFDQLALFWYDGTRFWLLPAEASEPPRPLPATASVTNVDTHS